MPIYIEGNLYHPAEENIFDFNYTGLAKYISGLNYDELAEYIIDELRLCHYPRIRSSEGKGDATQHYVLFPVTSYAAIAKGNSVSLLQSPRKANSYASVASRLPSSPASPVSPICRLREVSESSPRAISRANTILLKGAKKGQCDQIKQALDAGANINVQDQDGNTALLLALQHRTFLRNTISTLLEFGASVSICNNEGFIPLVLAVSQGRENAVTILLEHYKSLSSDYSERLLKKDINKALQVVNEKKFCRTKEILLSVLSDFSDFSDIERQNKTMVSTGYSI